MLLATLAEQAEEVPLDAEFWLGLGCVVAVIIAAIVIVKVIKR